MYLASGYISLMLKSPKIAASLRSRFMRSTESYNRVFSTQTPINVWPMIAILLKRTDVVLEELRPTGSSVNERFLKNWRHITCFLTVSRLIGTFDFSAHQLIQFDSNKYSDEEIELTWEYIHLFDPKTLNNKGWRYKQFIVRLCQAFAKEFNVSGVQRIERGIASSENDIRRTVNVDMEFALKVNALLPTQPWKPGIHKDISKALNCSIQEYFSAVKLLIDEGIRNQQKDGVVYDSDGNVLCFDPERVNPESMTLLDMTGV
jgi:hypothetical protein